MQEEIEAKFLEIDHDQIRAVLAKLGAELIHPMRLMRRTVFDYPDGRLEKSKERLRVRDEGDKITVTYKSKGKRQYSNEIETTVGSYETMSELLEAIGLQPISSQESKRETWSYKNLEIVLDEWPWVPPYMEIEGPSEAAIQQVAQELGLDWSNAAFGPAESAYRKEYPGIKDGETIGSIPVISFGAELPDWLKQRS